MQLLQKDLFLKIQTAQLGIIQGHFTFLREIEVSLRQFGKYDRYTSLAIALPNKFIPLDNTPCKSLFNDGDTITVVELSGPIPRTMQQWNTAEIAIYNAIQEVEKMPTDVILTDAVIKLGEAKSLIEKYIRLKQS